MMRSRTRIARKVESAIIWNMFRVIFNALARAFR